MESLYVILEVLFWLTLGGILHTYLLYPLLMRFLGVLRPVKKKTSRFSEEEHPHIEIIMAAHNEEAIIREKITSSFASDYPAGRLSVRIGSDASDDATDSIVQQMQLQYPVLHLHRFSKRSGKSAIINALVAESQADLILFTDANILFDRHTIPELLAALKAGRAGIAGGTLRYRQIPGRGISRQEDFYLRWENRLKQLESDLFGCAMGVEGSCYLMRRKDFPGIPPQWYMEDFYVSMRLMRQGQRVVMAPRAQCYEDVSVYSEEEYKRKVRISVGNFQNLQQFGRVIWQQFWPVGFCFLSHKVLRWLTPFFLLTLLVCGPLLAPHAWYYALFAGSYFAVIGLGLFGILFSRYRVPALLRFPGHFIHMNLALLEGFVIFTKGVQSNVWQPTRRNQN